MFGMFDIVLYWDTDDYGFMGINSLGRLPFLSQGNGTNN